MWRLTPRPRTRYRRNPLEVVLVQLQFHPILKLPERIGEFQDRVRSRFPMFTETALQSFDIQLNGATRTRSQQLFKFSTEDGRQELHASETALTLHLRDYQRREELSRDFLLGVESLYASMGKIHPRRLGLRFINILRKERIAAELDRETSWAALVDEEFRRLPAVVGEDAEVRMLYEITSECEPGALTLRYGLVPEPSRQGTCFRFDLDRYLEGSIDDSTIESLLGRFTDDCFALFHSAVGPDLRDWMGPEVDDV